jgi:hypothetical protein
MDSLTSVDEAMISFLGELLKSSFWYIVPCEVPQCFGAIESLALPKKVIFKLGKAFEGGRINWLANLFRIDVIKLLNVSTFVGLNFFGRCRNCSSRWESATKSDCVE